MGERVMKKYFNIFYPIILTGLVLVSCTSDNAVNNIDNPEYDDKKIDEAFQLISQVQGIRSLVVSFNSEIIREEYFNNTGPGPDSILDVRSVTKSITSTLIGIALDKGYLKSLNQTLDEFIAPLVDTLSTKMGAITIRQLLTMTAGFEWHEINEESEFPQFVYAPDQLEYVLNKPFIHTPGTVFNYSDGAAHLTSVVLTEATGMSASEFANVNLFEPLGIGERFWYEDNRGYNYGGVGLCIGPHDMIKIGQLIMQKGEYNGKKIVSENWIDKATSVHITTNNALPYLPNYGYYWWKGNQYGHDFSMAVGYGGQFIIIVHDLSLVASATCEFRGLSDISGRNWNSIINIIMNNVMPAFIDTNKE